MAKIDVAQEANETQEPQKPQRPVTGRTRLEELTEEAFKAGGPLSRGLSGFVARPSQRAFALAVARAIEEKATLIAEAGTGTGKTFAYLVPALLAGVKVLISTAGKPLQEQLYGKDLPLILKALGYHANCVLLKGRSNYICKKRLEEVRQVPTRDDAGYLRDIKIFAMTSETGDRSELSHIPENDPIWPLVTSTHENCPASKCPHQGECFLAKARRAAREADIVVVNHHLFLSSLAMAADGGEEILPSMPLTVIDEAHQLPSIATEFFGDVFSSRALSDFAKEVLVAAKTKARDGADWDELTAEVDRQAKELPLAAATDLGLTEGDRVNLRDIDLAPLKTPLGRISLALDALSEALSANAGRDPDLDLLMKRCEAFGVQAADWETFVEESKKGGGVALFGTKNSDGRQGAEKTAAKAEGKGSEGEEAEAESPRVRWILMGRAGVRLYDTPLAIGEKLRALREEKGNAWVLTSATLSVAGDFAHFLSETGLEGAETAAWPSPFDYFSQAALYIPRELPNPNAPDFSRIVAEKAWPFVKKARGRAFFLCTSLRAVDAVSDRLQQLAREAKMPLRILKQGDGSRKGLLDQYRSEKCAVLVGSMSFWEGIDIKGDALSVVVIDRIPFSPPDEPVFAARCEWIREQGGSPFLDYQVPEAVTLLRQGAGRLVRSETDRGVFILCDARVLSRWDGYGKTVVESLPDFCRTVDEARALAFLPDHAA